MWKVTDENYEYVERVLKKEREKNIYILGDIAQYGLDGEHVECFAGGELECIQYVLMRFCNSYVLYMPVLDLATEELHTFFQSRKVHCISGEGDTIKYIQGMFEGKQIIDNKMLKIDSKSVEVQEENRSQDIRSLSIEDISEIQRFYGEIEEFKEKFSGESGRKKIEEQFGNGKIMGLYKEGRLASIAALSAETAEFAMVDNVATAREFRRQGLGCQLLKTMCFQELVERQKEFLCVCCDDIRAEKLYKKVGFQEIGIYSMLYPK